MFSHLGLVRARSINIHIYIIELSSNVPPGAEPQVCRWYGAAREDRGD